VISQAVFAAYLNVTIGVVCKGDRAEKQPRSPAAKLLSLAAKRGFAAIAHKETILAPAWH
jgi:DNA-binding transcriptional regulator YiaG